MAWYKWLNEENYDPIWRTQWPQLGEVGDTGPYHVYPGSKVCSYIPWRYMPSTLFRVEPDGDYTYRDGQAFFQEVVLTEYMGVLRDSDVPQLVLGWLDSIIKDTFPEDTALMPDQGWNRDAIKLNRDKIEARIQGGAEVLLPKIRECGDRATILAAEAIEAGIPRMAWCYAVMLAEEAKSPQLGLEFAKVMDKALKGE